ncbi:MAG: hypothetical protein UT97_C0020G0019 [Parcubacteria group bacterium GW2011_GWC2_40_31]|nr:MAG: hypothetical protein UT97_C0020G0019 [Parcubacteria group bacterium GW2011_GWC2_40_31]
MHKKQLENHIENDDYFGTLATVINMARQTLEKDMRGPKKMQENYKIDKK